MANKMVLIRTEPERVFIQNDAGVRANFHSFAQFYEYSGITIPGSIARVSYEPARDRFRVNGEQKDIATQGGPYEAQIASVEEYAEKLNNPFFGMTLEEAKSYKRGLLDDHYRELKKAEYQQGQNKLSWHGLQTLSEITEHALLAKANGDTGWTIDAIMSTTDPNGNLERKTLTADQVLGFMQNLMGRNEALNQLAQDKKDYINGLTTVQAVKDYVIS